MNNKVVIGIVVVLVAVVAIFFLSKSGSLYSPSPTQTSIQIPPSTTSITQQPNSTNEATIEQNVVTLTQDGFSPSTLTVKAGTKVTWVNKSGSQVTVNSKPHPVHTNYSPLNLGSFSDGSTLSLTFDKPGTYGYHNHLNPSQSGTIIIQ